jgi:hypothetical protein
MRDHRLYGAPSAFEHSQWFLMQRKPTVLQVQHQLTLDLGPIHVTRLDLVPGWEPHENQTWRDWPTACGPAAGKHSFPIRKYNPSVIPLLGEARAICRNCAYVAALRADMFHQCPGERLKRMKRMKRRPKPDPWRAPFHGTIIALLDRELRPLGWTWLISAPDRSLRKPEDVGSRRWNCSLPLNLSDGFQPSWAEAAYDTRLLNVGDAAGTILFAHHMSTLVIKRLMLSADVTESGGLTNLRAWYAYRSKGTLDKYIQGRDQAIFVSSTVGDELHLFVQPRIGLVATYGQMLSRRVHAQCDRERECKSACPCGPHGDGFRFPIRQVRMQHAPRLFANETGSLRQLDLGGLRLSTTANLIQITYPAALNRSACPAWACGGRLGQAPSCKPCQLLLGVGHVHRSDSEKNLRMFGVSKSSPVRRAMDAHRIALGLGPNEFDFGAHYTHFFYAMQPCAPFAVVAVSEEFCLEAQGAPGDCESVQFISGLEHLAASSEVLEVPAAAYSEDSSSVQMQVKSEPRQTGEELLLSYGVNDCEAKAGRVRVDRILSMLKPIAHDATAKSQREYRARDK